VTLKVRPDVPSLRSAKLVRDFESSLRKGCERGRFRVVHYSIQSNHVHAIVEAASQQDLSCGMKSFGARLARAVNRMFRRKGPVLADRFHAHVLRTPREVRNAISYVLLNARRHAAALGRCLGDARIDPASSGRWFDGWRFVAFTARIREKPAVALPRTWLLATGWRRAGLIQTDEVPGARRCR
jgi:REP element-mobilizing transposase RayT